jgi:hypothetical protein
MGGVDWSAAGFRPGVPGCRPFWDFDFPIRVLIVFQRQRPPIPGGRRGAWRGGRNGVVSFGRLYSNATHYVNGKNAVGVIPQSWRRLGRRQGVGARKRDVAASRQSAAGDSFRVWRHSAETPLPKGGLAAFTSALRVGAGGSGPPDESGWTWCRGERFAT